MYTAEEYKNLVTIERNLKAAKEYLFKGIKETKSVIGDDGLKPELYDAFVGAKELKKQNDSIEASDDGHEERKEAGDEDHDRVSHRADSPSP